MNEIVEMLNTIGLPFAYHHFAEGESPEPPFIVYLCPDTDNVYADDTVYLDVTNVNIELYTDRKDIATEKRIEAALKDRDFPYEKSETWIDSEKLYEVLYQTQMIGG